MKDIVNLTFARCVQRLWRARWLPHERLYTVDCNSDGSFGRQAACVGTTRSRYRLGWWLQLAHHAPSLQCGHGFGERKTCVRAASRETEFSWTQTCIHHPCFGGSSTRNNVPRALSPHSPRFGGIAAPQRCFTTQSATT